MSDNEKKLGMVLLNFKLAGDGTDICPLCGGIIHVVSPGRRTWSCGLIVNYPTGDCWIPAKDVPQAVVRRLRGTNV